MFPIFFPTTYISRATLSTCFEWFDKMIVYQPSELDIPQEYEVYPQLIIKSPLTPYLDCEKLKQERLYLKTMGNALGPKLGHLKGRSDDLPFFDESSVNRIRAQIKQQSDNADFRPLLYALYGHLIQDLDMQQADLIQTLAEIDDTQNQMFQTLKHEEQCPEFQTDTTSSTPLDHVMNRLKAWFYIFQYDSEKPTLFLTDNPNVPVEMKEWNTNLDLIFSLDHSQMRNPKDVKQLFERNNINIKNVPEMIDNINAIHLYTNPSGLIGPFMPSGFRHEETIQIIVLDLHPTIR